MKAGTMIIGVILFAIATMFLYGWGLVKQKNETSDLMNLLFSKGEREIKKHLKKKEYITIADVEKLSENLEAKMPFSKNKAVVKDKRDFAQKLLAYMIKTDQLIQEGNQYKMKEKK